ncbi:MAG: ferrous iron transport protein B [Verrucomicrobiae bacterium]|nr:ferrous iron transport protein B [Verrucomicrobiae bacterium]MDW7980295.1 ferrous iron transport protein B [Verrucomicrobiales bacterium]
MNHTEHAPADLNQARDIQRDTQPRAGEPAAPSTLQYVVLTGNPNTGKTSVFNALTGLRAKVGNYAGVTVERIEGRLVGAPAGLDVRVLDLPGAYSLRATSVAEQVACDVLLQRQPDVPPPALVVIVLDASNLERNLYYATQVIELGYPTLVALNMVDVAEANGIHVDTSKLADALGVPVIPTIATGRKGIPELRQAIISALQRPACTRPKSFCALPGPFQAEVDDLARLLATVRPSHAWLAPAEALLLLSSVRALESSMKHLPKHVIDAVHAARARLEAANIDWRTLPIEARYATAQAIHQAVATEHWPRGETVTDKLDRVLTHRLWGTVIFLSAMALMFQAMFVFGRVPSQALQAGFSLLGRAIESVLPPGDLTDLLVNGVIGGVGAVVVFLPQILLLFLFIEFLEDTGYMARVAFLMDRVLSKVGLAGKSFIPLLCSFGCAIPGIMAARAIESPRDRLVTCLVVPLMGCSARLPVYTLLISACIPETKAFGVLNLRGLTMLGMYILGIAAALSMAWLFKNTLLKGEPSMLVMELPPYRKPLLGAMLIRMWDRAKLFLYRAGTVILGVNIILWFLLSYPRDAQLERASEAKLAEVRAQLATGGLTSTEAETAMAAIQAEREAARLTHSFAGRLGRLIEPVIAPLGFDWKIGIGIVASFGARELFVSTMAIIHNMGQPDDTGLNLHDLAQKLRTERRPDGTPAFTTLTGVTLMVFYVFALQCASTVAVMWRETNSLKWPLIQWIYMGALAWIMAFLTRQLGLLLGLG